MTRLIVLDSLRGGAFLEETGVLLLGVAGAGVLSVGELSVGVLIGGAGCACVIQNSQHDNSPTIVRRLTEKRQDPFMP